MARHIKANLRAWRVIALPRIGLHLAVHLCILLERADRALR